MTRFEEVEQNKKLFSNQAVVEIKNCENCPFANKDNEYGSDACNLVDHLGLELRLSRFEELPADKRHADCPIDKQFTIITV